MSPPPPNVHDVAASKGFPCSSVSKESACSPGDPGSILGWEDPLEKEMAIHGKSHGQRSLVGCSPWGHKESGTTDQLTLTDLLSCQQGASRIGNNLQKLEEAKKDSL